MAKDTSENRRIAVIGMGHMGTALLKGLVNGGISRSRILVSDSSKHNAQIVRRAGVVFIAVKPAMVHTVLADIKAVADGKVVVSLAAGVTISAMRKILGKGVTAARIMPNIPVAYGEGVIGLYAPTMSSANKRQLKNILAGLGLIVDVKKERNLDALTLIAGCGPGIVSFFVAMVGKRARALGLRDADAIALQTFGGTLAQLKKSRTSATRLIEAVATEGGVTEAILKELERNGLERTFARAIKIGHAKIKKTRT